jgi:annexin A7/11
MGTNEFLLVELIMGRSGSEIRWLKTGYRMRYGKDLTAAVKSDVSGKLERSAYFSIESWCKAYRKGWLSKNLIHVVFVMALNAQKPNNEPYIDYVRVEADADTLNNAAKKKDEVRHMRLDG